MTYNSIYYRALRTYQPSRLLRVIIISAFYCCCVECCPNFLSCNIITFKQSFINHNSQVQGLHLHNAQQRRRLKNAPLHFQRKQCYNANNLIKCRAKVFAQTHSKLFPQLSSTLISSGGTLQRLQFFFFCWKHWRRDTTTSKYR